MNTALFMKRDHIMTKSKAVFFLKEILYFLIVLCVAFFGNLLTFSKITPRYVSDNPGYSSETYQYNYLLYALGFMLFVAALVLLYIFLLKKDMPVFAKGGFIFKAITCIIPVPFSIAMLYAHVLTGLFKLGFNGDMYPGFLLAFSFLGWPIINTLFLWIMFIKTVIAERSTANSK